MRIIALSLLLLAACGDDGGSSQPPVDAAATDAAPTQTVTDTKRLLVSEIIEATADMGPGDRAVITLSAPGLVDWNIHGHANGQTQTVHEEYDVMESTYTFAPTAEAEWFLLLRSQHTAPMDVQVTIDFYGDVTWNGWGGH